MPHLSLSLAAANVVADGQIMKDLKYPQHGWPNMTAWIFKPEVALVEICKPERNFRGNRLFFHKTEVEFINQKSNGAFLRLCANGENDRFVLLIHKQEDANELGAALDNLPEPMRWKVQTLLQHILGAIVFSGARAILLISHG